MTYEELIHQSDFEQISVLDYDDIKDFVNTEIRRNKGWIWIARGYQVCGALVLLILLVLAIVHFVVQQNPMCLIWMGAGVAFSVSFLIVLHELIHMIAYRAIGVTRFSFGMNLAKFEFYVSADRIVLDYKQSKIVALAPALVIGLITLLGFVAFFNQPFSYFLLSVFSIHSLFCMGDFGLLCFFQNRPQMEIYNFDINKEKKTYFYGRKINGKSA